MTIFWWGILIIHQLLALLARVVAKERKSFEELNYSDPMSQSFAKLNLKAQDAFEISSEGEWEQVRSQVLAKLKQGDRIELIYSSESLSQNMNKLGLEYPEALRILRLPLVTFSIFSPYFLKNWLTSPRLTLVRYDFFPELLIQGALFKRELILKWATLKNKSGLKLFFQILLSKNFHQIYPATKSDEMKFKYWLNDLVVNTAVDGRTESIQLRLKNRELKLKTNFPFYEKFKALVNQNKKRLIIGSAYQDEMDFVMEANIINLIKKQQLFLTIVPHKLNTSWVEFLLSRGISCYRIHQNMTEDEFKQLIDAYQTNGGVWLIDLKGVLCELYQDFPLTYVGGGFHKSIHSTLEPFLAGSTVLTGPKVHRSTEVDLICEMDRRRYHLFHSQTEISAFLKLYAEAP